MRRLLAFCAIAITAQMIVPCAKAAELIVCENEFCSIAPPQADISQYLIRIKDLLVSSANGRVDFCDASPVTHLCQNDAISWKAFSDSNQFDMAIANARVNVIDKNVSLDYILEANNSFPRCMFSPLKLTVLPDKQLRLVSYVYNCRLLETEPANLQKIFYVDFIDFDKRVIGGSYILQSGGAIEGETSGYALMQIRDAKTPLPLVARRYRNLAPRVPLPAFPEETIINLNELPNESIVESETGLNPLPGVIPESEIEIIPDPEVEATLKSKDEQKQIPEPEPKAEEVVEPKTESRILDDPHLREEPTGAFVDPAPEQSLWERMGNAFDKIGNTAEKVLYLEPLD